MELNRITKDGSVPVLIFLLAALSALESGQSLPFGCLLQYHIDVWG